VPFILIQPDLVTEIPDLAVNPHLRVAVSSELFQLLRYSPSSLSRWGRERLEPSPLKAEGAPSPSAQGSAKRSENHNEAERLSDPGEKEPKIIIDLCHCPDGGARASRNAALIDGNRRGKAFHRLDVGSLHLL